MARLKARVLELNRTLARFYHSCLRGPQGKPGLDYLHGRGLANRTIIRFGLGYAPDSWDTACKYLRSRGFTDDEMVSAAVAAPGEERRPLRQLPQPGDLPNHRPAGQRHRLRRAGHGGREGTQIPQLVRHARL